MLICGAAVNPTFSAYLCYSPFDDPTSSIYIYIYIYIAYSLSGEFIIDCTQYALGGAEVWMTNPPISSYTLPKSTKLRFKTSVKLRRSGTIRIKELFPNYDLEVYYISDVAHSAALVNLTTLHTEFEIDDTGIVWEAGHEYMLIFEHDTFIVDADGSPLYNYPSPAYPSIPYLTPFEFKFGIPSLEVGIGQMDYAIYPGSTRMYIEGSNFDKLPTSRTITGKTATHVSTHGYIELTWGGADKLLCPEQPTATIVIDSDHLNSSGVLISDLDLKGCEVVGISVVADITFRRECKCIDTLGKKCECAAAPFDIYYDIEENWLVKYSSISGVAIGRIGCHSGCMECAGGGYNECTLCTGTQVLSNGECLNSCTPEYPYKLLSERLSLVNIIEYYECLSVCPIGKYPDQNATCVDCFLTCSTCKGNLPNNCVTCYQSGEIGSRISTESTPDAAKYWWEGNCLTSCPHSDLFDITLDNKCVYKVQPNTEVEAEVALNADVNVNVNVPTESEVEEEGEGEEERERISEPPYYIKIEILNGDSVYLGSKREVILRAKIGSLIVSGISSIRWSKIPEEAPTTNETTTAESVFKTSVNSSVVELNSEYLRRMSESPRYSVIGIGVIICTETACHSDAKALIPWIGPTVVKVVPTPDVGSTMTTLFTIKVLEWEKGRGYAWEAASHTLLYYFSLGIQCLGERELLLYPFTLHSQLEVEGVLQFSNIIIPYISSTPSSPYSCLLVIHAKDSRGGSTTFSLDLEIQNTYTSTLSLSTTVTHTVEMLRASATLYLLSLSHKQYPSICNTHRDCANNGVCSSGTCNCYSKYTGTYCHFLTTQINQLTILTDEIYAYIHTNYITQIANSLYILTERDGSILADVVTGMLSNPECTKYIYISSLIPLLEGIEGVLTTEYIHNSGTDPLLHTIEAFTIYLDSYWRSRRRIAGNVRYSTEELGTTSAEGAEILERGALSAQVAKVMKVKEKHIGLLGGSLLTFPGSSPYIYRGTIFTLYLRSQYKKDYERESQIVKLPESEGELHLPSDFLSTSALGGRVNAEEEIILGITEWRICPFVGGDIYKRIDSKMLSIEFFAPNMEILDLQSLPSPVNIVLPRDGVIRGTKEEMLECQFYDPSVYKSVEEVQSKTVDVTALALGGVSRDELLDTYPEYKLYEYTSQTLIVEVEAVTTVSVLLGDFISGGCGVLAYTQTALHCACTHFSHIAALYARYPSPTYLSTPTAFYTQYNPRSTWYKTLGFYVSLTLFLLYIILLFVICNLDHKKVLEVRRLVQMRRKRQGERLEPDIYRCQLYIYIYIYNSIDSLTLSQSERAARLWKVRPQGHIKQQEGWISSSADAGTDAEIRPAPKMHLRKNKGI